MLLVEQNAKLALEICHRGYVMESGLITATDSAADCSPTPACGRLISANELGD